MASPKNDVLFALLAAVESTYGAGVALNPATAGDAVLVSGKPTITVDYKDQGARADFNSPLTGAKWRDLPRSGRFGRVTIPFQPAGFGAAYGAANLPLGAALYRAAGMTQTVVTTPGSESVTFTPSAQGSQASAALRAYGNEHVYDLNGVYFERFTLSGEDGGILTAEVEGSGIMPNLPTDLVVPAIAGYAVAPAIIDPPKIESSVLTIGSHNVGVVREVEFNFTRPMGARGISSATGAHAGFNTGVGREAVLRCMIEAPDLATSAPWHTATLLNPWQLAETQTIPAGGLAFRAGAAGAGGQYRRLRLTAANPQLGNIEEDSSDGIVRFNLTFNLKPSTFAANDEFSLIHD